MYLIEGHRSNADQPGFADLLADARESRKRPICLCSEPGIEMYIARLPDGCIVKRLPYTGNQHAPHCPHFEPPADASGLGQLTGSAISEDTDSGITLLNLGFAMSKGASRAVPTGTHGPKGSVSCDGSRLSLRGLLHFLWDQAELMHWRPGFAGKRTWAVVRSHLLRAVQNKTARGVPLAPSFYIPEVFSTERRAEISERRTARFLRGTAGSAGAGHPLLLLIAELKEVVPARFGFKAVIKHVPDQSFALDRQLHRRMSNHFARELLLWAASDSIHMMVIATFGLNSAGLPALEELSLMPVTAQWIPVDDEYDERLEERLVHDARAFVKLQTHDTRSAFSRASAMLLDAAGDAVPLRLRRPSDEHKKGSWDAADPGAGSPSWVWNVAEENLPAFPACRGANRSRVLLNSRLKKANPTPGPDSAASAAWAAR